MLKTSPSLAKSDIYWEQTLVSAFDQLAIETPTKALAVKETPAGYAMFGNFGVTTSTLLKTESYAPQQLTPDDDPSYSSIFACQCSSTAAFIWCSCSSSETLGELCDPPLQSDRRHALTDLLVTSSAPPQKQSFVFHDPPQNLMTNANVHLWQPDETLNHSIVPC